MPVAYSNVYLHAAGMFLPGEPVDNAGMDAYVAPLNRLSERLKRRILAENGIVQRHYAIDPEGRTVHSNTAMAAQAIQDCLAQAGRALGDVGFLASGSSGGDALMPGFASMIQGEMAAPPMETLSVHGVCAASVGALQAAAQAVDRAPDSLALAVASEMPSRLFKRSRFAAQGYNTDFDAHFLRWMLSDGAGAVLLGGPQALPQAPGLRLKLRWTHLRSFAGDYPVCMQLGLTPDRATSHLDFAAWGDAEAAGALSLRQDIRLLPHLFDVCIHEYAHLAHTGWVPGRGIDHFLCHYSSERFIPVVDELLGKAQLGIPRERWWSNLAWRGNTGAASIFVMLSEFLRTQSARASSRLVAKKLVCHCAVKPLAVTSRLLGRYSPTKLGCGQSELSSTRLSRPTGVMLSCSVPCSLRSKANSRLCPPWVSSAGSGACTPAPKRSSALPGAKLRFMPLKRSCRSLLMPRISLMPTERKGRSN